MDNRLSWFNNIPVLGDLPQDEAAARLREVGEEAVANRLLTPPQINRNTPAASLGVKDVWQELFPTKPYGYTGMLLGYISPQQQGPNLLHIDDVSNIPTNKATSLRGARVKISLSCLRVAEYPGGGIHQILLHCAANNQIAKKPVAAPDSEFVHFNATYRVRQGQIAPVKGYPIFIGLNVGNEGLLFKFRTINVKNERDESFLNFLHSGVFKTGLQLLSTVQPAVTPLSAMAFGIAEAIAQNRKNLSIQEGELGLDFNPGPGGTHLAEGAYIVAQGPTVQWNWSGWALNANNNLIIHKDNQLALPYNYLIFNISRYDEDLH